MKVERCLVCDRDDCKRAATDAACEKYRASRSSVELYADAETARLAQAYIDANSPVGRGRGWRHTSVAGA